MNFKEVKATVEVTITVQVDSKDLPALRKEVDTLCDRQDLPMARALTERLYDRATNV